MATSISPVLPEIEGLRQRAQAPLSEYTRFGIGGPADLLAEASTEASFVAALRFLRSNSLPFVVIGAGTNLVVSDEGYRGTVLRYTAKNIEHNGQIVGCDAGADLMELVYFAVGHSLAGIETLMGIPGSVGAAIYGNAGAYGHAIAEVVRAVRFFDGEKVGELPSAACEFRYRESAFKRRKHWVVLRAQLELRAGEGPALRETAEEILAVRNAKFPPTMQCAGSIFKNLVAAELPANVRAQVPERVVREGKIPSAWFLEQAGAKGAREGGIHIADYHANLIFNAGGGTAAELRVMIQRQKSAVAARFGITLEEEVQYLGFPID